MTSSAPERRTRPRLPAPLVGLAALACLALTGWTARTAERAPTEGPWRAVVLGPAKGELEPCGCTGGQFGGIDRVASAVSLAASRPGAPLMKLAAGGVVEPAALDNADWALAQLETLWMAYGQLGVNAVALSSRELALGLEVVDGWSPLLGGATVVATNVLRDDPAGGEGTFAYAPAHQDPGSGALVMAFVADGLRGPGWRSISPFDAQARLAPQGLDPAGRDVVAFVEGDEARAIEVSRVLPPDAIVLRYDDEHADPDELPLPLRETGVSCGHVGERGRYVVELARSPVGGHEWTKVAVSQAIPVAPEFSVFREQYRLSLAATDVVGQLADALGDPPRGGYTGSDVCGDCHAEAYEIWKETLHHQGTHTLLEDLRGSADALSDPDCIRCHTTGFGWKGGWASTALPEGLRREMHDGLAGIGCEACHGPGARHVETEAVEDIDLSSSGTCLGCHDSENDAEFDFAKKWPLVEH